MFKKLALVVLFLAIAVCQPSAQISLFRLGNSPLPPPLPVSPNSLTLPAGGQHYWGLVQAAGYAGHALEIARSLDSATTTCDFDVNKMVDQNCITTFCPAGCTAYVRTLYDQISAAPVDMLQTTLALMPVISVDGVVVVTDSGLPAMRGAFEGRFMSAANAMPAPQEFSVTAFTQNNNPQLIQSANNYSPIVGLGSGNSDKWYVSHGSRNVAGRLLLSEMVSDAGQPQSEVVGWAQPVNQGTSTIITTTVLAANLTGGPPVGSSIYYNRSGAFTSNHAVHTPLNIACPCDIRLFMAFVAVWTTNSANGADNMVTLVYQGLPMVDSDRQSLEGQIYDKGAALISQNMTLPALNALAEAWDFSTYASNAVNGVNGKTNLQFQTAANGATFSLTTAPSGLVGTFEPTTSNFHNDFQATSTFGADQTTFTMWVVVTPDSFATIYDFIAMATGTLGVDNHQGSVLLSHDHSPFCAWTNNNTSTPAISYTNLMLYGSDPNAGRPAYWQWGFYLGFMPIVVPAHDNIVSPSAHPPFYTQKKFLGDVQTTDAQQFPTVVDMPIMLIVKHKPNPNYNFAEAYDSANNVFWRNKATVEVKAAYFGGLDGFGKVIGFNAQYPERASIAIADLTSRFRHYGGEGLGTFQGWSHAAGWYGNHYTTDAEDQALFYKWKTGVLH